MICSKKTKLVRNRKTISYTMDCSICTCSMENQKVLPCGHAFCSVCIAKWFVRKPTCPLCRADCWKVMMDWLEDPEAPLVLHAFMANPDQWSEWLDVDGPPPLLEEDESDGEIPLTQPPATSSDLPSQIEALEQWMDEHPSSHSFFSITFDPSQIQEEPQESSFTENDYENMWRDIAIFGETVGAFV